jgi:hypothetical protein
VQGIVLCFYWCTLSATSHHGGHIVATAALGMYAQASSTRAASTAVSRTRLRLEHPTLLESLAPPPRPSPMWAPCYPFARGAESSNWPLCAYA